MMYLFVLTTLKPSTVPSSQTRVFALRLLQTSPNSKFLYFSTLNMELALIEPQIPANSPNCDLLINESYEQTLNQSIQNLLHEYKNGVSDFSPFISSFYELVQARVNPPLEAIWVFSALSFRSSNVAKDDALNRVSIVKDLFQFVSACSASCNDLKSIALLAPVVFEVHHLVVELLAKDLSVKREKKAMREVVSLVEAILGYVNVCCCNVSDEEDDDDLVGSIGSFSDLVCVWMKGNGEGSEGIKSFLPVVSEEIRKGVSEGECDVSYLAGVVMVEVFLLRLCLKFRGRIPKQELEKELRNWAVGSITGFKSYYFFETLLRLLLEPTLPVTSLLNSEEERLLKKVLYDAVILVDYSFLSIEKAIPERTKSLPLTRVLVTHEAIEFFRENGDQKRAISYINAFSGSSLHAQLIRCVTSRISTVGSASRPNGSSPTALIKWLLNLEDQGIRVFDDSISKSRAKLLIDVSAAKYEQPEHEAGGEKLNSDIIFYVDNKGEEEDTKETNDSMTAAFVAAARTMADNDGTRKRKKKSSEKKKQIKFHKYNLYDNSDAARDERTLTNDDSSNSGSEVENPVSDDDDVEDKE